MQVPSGLEIFIDTNFFIYSITVHPHYGAWCEKFLERVKSGDIKGRISVIVLNELMHKLIVGEIAEKKNIKPFSAVSYIKKNPDVLENLKAYEIVEEVASDYNVTIIDIKKIFFWLAS